MTIQAFHIRGSFAPSWNCIANGLRAGLALLTFIAWVRKLASRRFLVVVCGSILLLSTILFTFDRLNLLVDYDLWLRRGMPDRWELSK